MESIMDSMGPPYWTHWIRSPQELGHLLGLPALDFICIR